MIHIHAHCGLRRALLAAALFLTVSLSATVARAEKIYLFIEESAGRGIAGESTERAHANWIIAESFGWGATNEGSPVGRGASKPKFANFRLVKRVDRASSVLSSAVINSKHYARAVMEVCREVNGQSQCYYRVTLNDVQVTNYQINATTTTSPTEEIGLSFSRIRWEYFSQAPDGRMVPAGSGGYDVRRGIQATLLPEKSTLSAEADRIRRVG